MKNEDPEKSAIIDRLFSLAAFHGWRLDTVRLFDDASILRKASPSIVEPVDREKA